MIGVNIRAEVSGARSYLDQVKNRAVNKAAVRALNRTASQVRTLATKEIMSATKLKLSYVKKRVIIKKAYGRRLTAYVVGKKGAPNLIEWVTKSQQRVGAVKKRSTRAKQGGVSASAWGSKKVYKGTFVGRGKKSGKLLVFSRGGKSASGLKTIYGPSVRATFIQSKIDKLMRREARSRFAKNFRHDLAYYLGRIK